MIDLPSFYMDMNGSRLGLSNFRSTSRDLEKILRDFTEKNVDAVVLDLRRDGGGSLLEAVKVTGLFIDQGPVVQVKDSRGRIEQLEDTDPGVAWAGPLVVLQSKMSASASEIFAGAIQDYGRGLIVGDRTSHGKGIVQQRDRHQPSAVRRDGQCTFDGSIENHYPAVLSPRWRKHAKSRCSLRYRTARAYLISAGGRIRFGLCDEIRSDRGGQIREHALCG